jgi:hypothetical protein
MTDETRKQILNDSIGYAESFKTGEWFENIRKESAIHAATRQDAIAEKRGHDLAIDEAIACVKLYSPYSVHVDVLKKAILTELEKLKK